jgi:Flp pilus assembly pilin Flp
MKNIVAYLFALMIVSSFTTQAQWIQLGQNIDGEADGDRSGRSVSLSSDGSVVAIGSIYNSGNGTESGHVRIYQNLDGTWTQIGNDIDGEAAGDQSGKSVSLSSNGSVIAIGAPFNDGAGHVRIFQNINGTWTQIGNDIIGEAAGDYFGYSVNMSSSGLIVAIGAPCNGGAGDNAGHVRIYQNIDGTWTQVGNDIDGGAASDLAGISVSLNSNGSIVSIGAPGYINHVGQVRIYQNLGGSWMQVGQDIDGAFYSSLGGSVSLSSDGSVVAMGGPKADAGNGRWSGVVRIYQNLNGTWVKIGEDILAGERQELSGLSVSLSSDGSIVSIGAPGNQAWPPQAGHCSIFQNLNGNWTQVGYEINGDIVDDYFGNSVSLSSDGAIVAIGALNNGNYAGQVKIYKNNSLVGIPEILNPGISVSPNPTTGIINFKFSINSSIQIYIYDIAGRIIYNNQLLMHNNQFQIDLSSFKNGIYIIKIQSDNNLYSTRIVKE